MYSVMDLHSVLSYASIVLRTRIQSREMFMLSVVVYCNMSYKVVYYALLRLQDCNRTRELYIAGS
jgi:hypothetical protein